MTLALCFENISFGYSSLNILENVDLKINSNEFIGLIGPNGGGKTTLLKLAMGFLLPQKGKVTLFGQDPKNSLLNVGYVPQVMHFDRQFPLSVEELVLAGRLSHLPWFGRFSKQDREAALHCLEQVGLEEAAYKPFSSLSGGQAQRALIARALATPKLQLLILDEPTAHIDSTAEEEIYSLLKKLHKTITILMVTHDLQAAISCFDRVLCVHRHAGFLDPSQVCEHYALGLYHQPLSGRDSWKKGL